MASMISLVTAKTATGSRDVISRKMRPMDTTVGPESHMILSTGGTLRRAERRSRQAIDKLFCSAMVGFAALGMIRLPVRDHRGGSFNMDAYILPQRLDKRCGNSRGGLSGAKA